MDWETLKERLDVLAQISPALAILDAWNLIESSILHQASPLEGIDDALASDVIAIARALPGMQDLTIDRLRKIRACRNLVVHGADLSKSGDELCTVVEDLVPVLEALDPRFSNLSFSMSS